MFRVLKFGVLFQELWAKDLVTDFFFFPKFVLLFFTRKKVSVTISSGHLILSALLGSRGSSKGIRPESREDGLTSLAFDMIATFTFSFSAISFRAKYDFKL